MYTMKISRMTVDKLGVKLYDKVSAVIAELVSNSYDADATCVEVTAPMGIYLATKQQGVLQDHGLTITVKDNGIGMTPEEVNEFYLKVGAERRTDYRRGDTSKKFGRKVMGRKGVGKLAPFGICNKIELITSGGDIIETEDTEGNKIMGYITAHLILDHNEIRSDDDNDYKPRIGQLNNTIQPKSGTTIIMSEFAHRKVPDIDAFSRQLAQRFGINSSDWSVVLKDSNKKVGDDKQEVAVGEFSVKKMRGTEIRFVEISDGSGGTRYAALDPDGDEYSDLKSFIKYEDTIYPITGWVAYSETPYKDDLMAGIRIYAHKKIAAQTTVFNKKAGFTGEHTIRSYLVGELHADFLDLDEDLIQTDRRDILWSHELGKAFEQWGQTLISKIGKLSREPMKKKILEVFKEVSKYEQVINTAFPLEEQREIREQAVTIAKLFGQTIRQDELEDKEHVGKLVELSLIFAPHVTLENKLREAAEDADTSLGVMAEILKTARVAELSSFGKIADDRIRVINKIEQLKDTPGTLEQEFQELIQSAPWLIDPQWAPITANQTFTTLKREFQKFYRDATGEEINLEAFPDPNKRMDFVLSTQDNFIEIIEIKRPGHNIKDEELNRIINYADQMEAFLNEPSNALFKKTFNGYRITLVADGLSLSPMAQKALNGLMSDGFLTHISWRTFLLNTRKMHEAFMNEAERQKRYGIRTE
ncbi:ATP-binding protein [Tumebacillus flagellatus]|uniref:ATP-binding protein n=1 Tax=Tumebacillus flagellatus TaxID=1157490 RepID=A0A074LJL7_9BACL|nr:ATP-binding protein [Tumebacillus flagellatus]KEO81294.1 hypothetical protein EL26_21715 [Tumebacillus flagellatus]